MHKVLLALLLLTFGCSQRREFPPPPPPPPTPVPTSPCHIVAVPSYISDHYPTARLACHEELGRAYYIIGEIDKAIVDAAILRAVGVIQPYFKEKADFQNPGGMVIRSLPPRAVNGKGWPCFFSDELPGGGTVAVAPGKEAYYIVDGRVCIAGASDNVPPSFALVIYVVNSALMIPSVVQHEVQHYVWQLNDLSRCGDGSGRKYQWVGDNVPCDPLRIN